MKVQMELPEQRDLIGGVRLAPAEDTRGWLTDPNDGRPIMPIRQSSSEQVSEALQVSAAVHAAHEWSESSWETRAELLNRIAAGLDVRVDDIAMADCFNSGVPISITTMFATGLGNVVRGAIAQLRAAHLNVELSGPERPVRLLRLPWGPVGVIVPFNAPSFIATKKTAYALAAGAPVVCKPSASAPSGIDIIADVIASAVEATHAPAGLFQLIHGAAAQGAALATDPRIRALSFTGSRQTGYQIVRASAGDLKSLQLELGSNNPAIVRADADVDSAAAALIDGFTKLNGQWCESPGSVFVPKPMHDAIVDAILDRLALIQVGSSLDKGTRFGPQANEGQRDHVISAISRLNAAGGHALSSTAVPTEGYFVAPTILRDADPGETIEEIFGPVLTIHATRDDDESLALANSRATGLAGYVFGTDQDEALRLGARIDCGEVKVNSTSLLDLTETSTQGFWGASGIGAHGDAELLQFFCGARIVGIDAPKLPL